MKNPKAIFEEERAVSPVVGVALLIAIAVILAAVVGAVVLGLGTSSADAPQASLSLENNTAGDLEISHDGGDPINDSNVVLRGDIENSSALGGSLSAGESVDTGDTVNDGDEVSVVWINPENGEETVLASEQF